MSNNNVPPHLRQEPAPAGNQTAATGASFEQQVIELKRRMKELDKREQSLNGALTREQIAAELQKDKASFLKGFGIELPEDKEAVPDHIREFREFRAQVEREKKEASDKEYRDSLLGKVKSDDKYELLNKLGNYDYLLGEIDKRREAGEEFDPFELFEQAEQATYSQLESLRDAKKLQPWFEKNPQNSAQNVPQGQNRHPLDANRTMTSNDRGTPSASDANQQRPLSRAESLARVAAKYGNPNNTQGND